MKIFLVGMMGSGKSTLAKMISKVLSIPYLDMDEKIEARENKTIKEIFEKNGESYFRDLESSLLKSLVKQPDSVVVATGGGIVLRPDNRELLKKETTIYLKVSPQELKKRVSPNNRPLLSNNIDNIFSIYNERINLYEMFESVDITYLNEWEAVAKILQKVDYKKNLSIDSSFQKIYIEAGSLKNIPKNAIVFTSEKVDSLYGEFFTEKKLVFPNGEEVKDIVYVTKAWEYLLENDVTRKDLLCGVGGGTITDFTGFVGSTYKRGMNFIFYPTTLLGQIDAAIGGKNGIDFKKYKNVIGIINLPNEVIIDPITTLSLDDIRFREGLIEGFKISLISGGEFYTFFKDHLYDLLNRNLDTLTWFIKRSVEEKLRIVQQDFKDTGLRSYLNLGHSLGHAFEAVTGIAHGLSVGWGLYQELMYSKNKKHIDDRTLYDIISILDVLLPSSIKNIKVEKHALLSYLSNDKKMEGSNIIKLPILKAPGEVIIEDIDYHELVNALF